MTGTEFPKDIQQAYDQRMGAYQFSPSRGQRFTAQALANYSFSLPHQNNFNLFLGAEYTESRSYSAGMGGYKFVLDGDFISLNNLTDKYLQYGSGDYQVFLNHAKRNKYGYFGEIRYDYRNVIQASVTGRIDGSSTLRQTNRPHYFYPSFTGGIIFSELLHLQNNWFSYGKIRGNWAKVGKDAPANQFSDNYKTWTNFPDGGMGVNPTLSRAITLEPEMTKSWEIGADLRFFRNRTRLDIAYYNTTVDNQIVTVRVSPSSGTILQTRNEGTIENKGLEFTLNQDIITSRDWNWTATLNFSYNRGKVVSLPENVSEITGGQYGDIFASAYAGESTTGLSGIDYLRNENGDILIDESGYPRISPKKDTYIGNREPDCLIGLGSTVSWKDLSLSLLFDGRIGGDPQPGQLPQPQGCLQRRHRKRRRHLQPQHHSRHPRPDDLQQLHLQRLVQLHRGRLVPASELRYPCLRLRQPAQAPRQRQPRQGCQAVVHRPQSLPAHQVLGRRPAGYALGSQRYRCDGHRQLLGSHPAQLQPHPQPHLLSQGR